MPPNSKFDIVPWNPSFETGIAIIDQQHQQLVGLINDLAHEYVYTSEANEIERVLEALIDYADYHFETEEAIWAEILAGDAWYEGHLNTHNGFIDKARAMQAKLQTGDRRALIDELLSFLTGWLAHHILYEDKRFSLVFLQLQEGSDLDSAKKSAQETMTGQTSGLIQSVLSMYKELSSRTLALEREAYSRQVAEQALLDQEQHWTSVLGASSDSLWDWDLSTLSDRPIAADLFSQTGFTIHPDDWPNLRQDLISHILGQSEVFQNIHRVIDQVGNERWMQSRGKIIEQDAAGQPVRMVGTQTDITERKTAELTLQRERDTRALISEFAADFMASSTEDFDAAINRALQRSGAYMQADRTYVFLLSADGQRMSNTHEWCAPGIAPEIKNLQHIPSSAVPWWWSQFRDVGYVLVNRINDMPAEALNEYHILESQGIRSVCVYPLYAGKVLIGFMGSDAVQTERHWDADVIEFLSLMSDLLGIALEHRKLHQNRTLAISQLERAEQLAHMGHWRIDHASQSLEWSQEIFRIFECDPKSFTPNAESLIELIHPEDRASALQTYHNAKSALSDLYLEHRIVLSDDKVKHLEIRGRFDSTAQGYPAIAEGTVQDVTEKVQHRNSLQRLAFQDSLTGLPNRRSIEETLRREMWYCEHNSCRLVLALLDLDNFRDVNEQYGAALGDNVLKLLAQRISQLLGDTAIVARIGGDEFVVLFTRLQPEHSYFQQLNRLLAVVNKPLNIDGINITLSTSIGVTEFPQPITVVADQLMRQAQQALFQAKILGKGHFQKYDISLERDTRALTDQLEEIRHALHAGEFVLHYQPKVHMKSGIVFGAEALLRWQKPSGELMPPSDFLPALHNHPLEIELGDWVIRTALEQMRSWKHIGLDLQVSVNISSLQLFDEAFVEKLNTALIDYADIEPAALQLEVLESSMIYDLEAVSEVMQRSSQLGVSWALDDFGTGFSSLTYLKHLPASVLKIDQSFVNEMLESPDDLSIISGVIGMANAFGMQVIAEGVETVEQGNLLLRLGCEQGQGYGIARPMPADQLPNWITQWQAEPSWLKQQPINIQNLPLLYAEAGHRRWVTQVEQWLRNESESIPPVDHHLCKAGIWIDCEAQSRLGLSSQFDHIVCLHRDLHFLGKSAISMHAKGEQESALLVLLEIKQKRDIFLAELRKLADRAESDSVTQTAASLDVDTNLPYKLRDKQEALASAAALCTDKCQ